jgi:hypothetical protein
MMQAGAVPIGPNTIRIGRTRTYFISLYNLLHQSFLTNTNQLYPDDHVRTRRAELLHL